jgi:hypothetical protein
MLDQPLTLRLCGFVFDKATMEHTLSVHWLKLQRFIFDHVDIMRRG